MTNKKHILVVTSTFPTNNDDPVPDFVKNQIITMHRLNPDLKFSVIAPHDQRSNTQQFTKHVAYNEYRFHYMWPKSLERLSGQGGIIPSLKKDPWLYAVIPFFMLAQLITVIRLTIKLKPDIINAHWIIPQGFNCVIAGKITGKKVIATVHGSDVFTFNNRFSTYIKQFVLKHSAVVVVNSTATQKRSQEIYDERDYQIIPMGVNTKTFNKIRVIKKPSDTLNILFVGRLSEEKGVKYLIKALVALKKHNINFNAQILGSGPEQDELKQLAKFLGLTIKDISFPGWISQKIITNYYQKADIFVGPSIESETGAKEALGVVFLEASAAGLPIIATKTGGIVDIVKDKETGFLIKPRSSSEIYDKLIELQQNPRLRHQLGKNAQVHVQKNFSWDSVASRYNGLIDSIQP